MRAKTPASVRVWKHIDRRGPDECWPWTASTNHWGYGQVNGVRPDGTKTTVVPHRVVYEAAVGPIPDGYHVDHTCHNADRTCHGRCSHRLCCNPVHLEAVPPRINKLRGNSPNAVNSRKTQCKRGHEFTPTNTIVKRNGNRECRTCHNADQRRYQQRRRERDRLAATTERK